MMRLRQLGLLMLTCYVGGCSCAKPPYAKDERVALQLEIDQGRQVYRASVMNGSQEAIRVLDTLSLGSRFTIASGPCRVLIMDDQGHLISDVPHSRNGWWDEGVLSSEGATTDDCILLIPGASLCGEFKIENTLLRLIPTTESYREWKKDKFIKLQFYVDVYESRMHQYKIYMVESPWFELDTLNPKRPPIGGYR